MFANRVLVDVDLRFVKFEVCWGWENGEGKLGFDVLGFQFFKDFHAVTLFSLHAWVIECALILTF
jgi:hypothetical protein